MVTSKPDSTRDSLNRRQLLGRVAILGVYGVSRSLQRSLAAAERPAEAKSRPGVSLGFSLYGMRSLKVGDALAACARIGYDAVELVCTEDWPCDPARLSGHDRREIRQRLADLNLELPALMENLQLLAEPSRHRKNLDRLKAAAELGGTLKSTDRPVVETILGGRPQQWESVKQQMARRLQDWGAVAEQQRTVIAVKPHVGGALHTPQGADWLVRTVDHPNIRLAYDYSHFGLRSFDLAGSLESLIDHTVFIHVKDWRGTVGQFKFLLPGDGDLDYVKYLTLLQRHEYAGSIVVEVSGQIHGKPAYDPIRAAEQSYANLSTAFSNAGVSRTGNATSQ